MSYDLHRHHRQSIRLQDYDYTQRGAYFVTICTNGRECLFGEIESGRICLNAFAQIVQEEWMQTKAVRSNVMLDEFIIMPNHLHGILVIHNRLDEREKQGNREKQGDPVGRPYGSTKEGSYKHPSGPVSGSLGAIIGQFKAKTTKRINTLRDVVGLPVWQRNYYERIVPDEHSLDNARRYIVLNPTRWADDKENPINFPLPSTQVPPL